MFLDFPLGSTPINDTKSDTKQNPEPCKTCETCLHGGFIPNEDGSYCHLPYGVAQQCLERDRMLWVPRMNSSTKPPVPSTWMECDVCEVTEPFWEGQKHPDGWLDLVVSKDHPRYPTLHVCRKCARMVILSMTLVHNGTRRLNERDFKTLEGYFPNFHKLDEDTTGS